jgi:Cu2+-exporting ATPase
MAGGGFSIAHETPSRLRLRVRALHDPALDAGYLAATLEALPGVRRVRINRRAASVAVRHDGDPATRARVLALLGAIPGEAFLPEAARAEPQRLSVLLSQAACTALVPWLPRETARAMSWLLALPTLAEGGQTLLTKGIKVAVLDASAVGFSLLREDWFTANAIVTMLGLGAYLEQWTEQKSDELLKNLLRPRVEAVWVERDAREERVPLAEVGVGDVVICGTGELVPVDGVVVGGEAGLNTSSITGEPLPVHVAPGDEVASGSVVEEGRVRIAARVVGSETGMARIGRFLENSLRQPSASQRRGDELADRLVPVTFGLGLAHFLINRDVRRAASVLTVDYSCAIKVAAPVAVKSCMHAAGLEGVLLRGGQALENLAKVDTVVFDKTGTLTLGDLEVTDVLPLGGMEPDQLLALAAGAEEHYAHPVARAVVRAARERGLEAPPISQVDFIVAHGVSAYVEGARVLAGSRHFLEEDEGVDCRAADAHEHRLRAQGKSLLYVSREGGLLGLLALRDEPRPEAERALELLRGLGIGRVVMLTGDHHVTARAIADGLGVDEVHSGLKPEDKARIVERMQEEGRFVAFAGDGVNDAPALITADVGICMPGGADLAREAAQVILLHDDLRLLAAAREMAERSGRVLSNTFRATAVINTGLLALATAGRISPVASAFLHNLTTLGIIGYAALAGRVRPSCAAELEEASCA